MQRIFSGILLTFLAFVTSETQALYCYNCRSQEPCAQVDECALANPNYMEIFRRMYFPNDRTDYSDPKNLPKPVCLTAVTIGRDGTVQTRRECSPLGNRLTCEVPKADAARNQGTLHTCKVCDKDFCNDMTIDNVPTNKPIPPHPDIVFTRPPTDTASHVPDQPDEQESPVPPEVPRVTPVPVHRGSTPRSNIKPTMDSGSSSHYAVLIATYVLACLSLVLQ